MLGFMTQSDIVAEYGIANKLVMVSSILLRVVNGIIAPKFSSLWREKKYQELKAQFLNSMIAMAGCAILIMIAFVIFGKSLLVNLYGNNFLSSYDLS